MDAVKKYKLSVTGLSKKVNAGHGISRTKLEDLTFNINLQQGAVNIFLSSQSDKMTSFLEIISGVDASFTGRVTLANEANGNTIKTVYIPQQPSSYPWLNVRENIEFVLEKNIAGKSEREAIVKTVLELTGLEGYDKHFPQNSSLGFRFRIALARALAVKADLIVLNYPFTEMEERTGEEIRLLLKQVSINTGVTFLLSSGSIEESAVLGDSVFLFGNNPFCLVECIKLDGQTIEEKERNLSGIIFSKKNKNICI